MFTPPRPTGSDEEALYHQAQWDARYKTGKLIDTPQIRFEHTTRGIIARVKQRRGRAASTDHPFKITIVASDPGDPGGTTRYNVSQGYVEWRMRYPDAALQALFNSNSQHLPIGYGQRMIEWPGGDIVITTGASGVINLLINENSGIPLAPTLVLNFQAFDDLGINEAGTYTGNGGPEEQFHALGLISNAGGIIQNARQNIFGQWTTATIYRGHWVTGNEVAIQIHYPGEMVLRRRGAVDVLWINRLVNECEWNLNPLLDTGEVCWTPIMDAATG